MQQREHEASVTPQCHRFLRKVSTNWMAASVPCLNSLDSSSVSPSYLTDIPFMTIPLPLIVIGKGKYIYIYYM